MFGIPETLPYSETLSLSASFCLSALPCHPQFETLPLKTLSGLAFLVCLVLFRSLRPGARRHFFTLSLDTDTNLSRNRPYCSSIPLCALPPNQNERKKRNKRREFTSIAASDPTEKSRCICIIVHTIQYIYTITPFVVIVFVFSTTTTTKPAPPLPCHKSKEQSKEKQKKRVQPNSISSRLPASLSLSLPFRSHSLPFWEVAQVQYIYTYYDPRKKLHVDSLLSR